MQNSEFEKQARQLMEELRFSPSDPVWENLQKRLRPRRRRRLLFWLPLLFLTGLGGGFYYIKIGSARMQKPTAAVDRMPSGTGPARTQKALDFPIQPKAHLQPLETPQRQPQAGVAKIPAGSGKPLVTLTSDRVSRGQIDDLTLGRDRNSRQSKARFLSLKLKASPQPSKYPLKKDSGQTDSPAEENGQEGSKENPVSSPASNGAGEWRIKNPEMHFYFKALLIPRAAIVGAVAVPSLPVGTGLSAEKSLPRAPRLWEWGWEGGLGTAWASSSLGTGADNFYYYQSSPATVSSPGGRLIVSSPEKKGLSGNLGLVLRRQLNPTWKLVGGIGYHYSSSRISVGNKADSSLQLNPANFGNRTVNSYYDLSGTGIFNYTNHFHFLVIPVGLEKQLGVHSPFSLMGQLSVAQLLGSNALHFNADKEIYFKDNSLINKTQFSAGVGFFYSLRRPSGITWRGGPVFQYGLSGLYKGEPSGYKHLLTAGLSVSFFIQPRPSPELRR